MAPVQPLVRKSAEGPSLAFDKLSPAAREAILFWIAHMLEQSDRPLPDEDVYVLKHFFERGGLDFDTRRTVEGFYTREDEFAGALLAGGIRVEKRGASVDVFAAPRYRRTGPHRDAFTVRHWPKADRATYAALIAAANAKPHRRTGK